GGSFSGQQETQAGGEIAGEEILREVLGKLSELSGIGPLQYLEVLGPFHVLKVVQKFSGQRGQTPFPHIDPSPHDLASGKIFSLTVVEIVQEFKEPPVLAQTGKFQ